MRASKAGLNASLCASECLTIYKSPHERVRVQTKEACASESERQVRKKHAQVLITLAILLLHNSKRDRSYYWYVIIDKS